MFSIQVEDFYSQIAETASEGIWRFELEKPIPVNLPTAEQVKLAYQYGYLAECNDAMAKMYGYERAEEIVGARLGDLVPQTDESNIEYLSAFIDSNYRLKDAESREIDRQGNPKFFLNNLVGIIENGHLARAWGTRRDITDQKEIESATARLAAIVESSDDAIISKDLNGIITSWNHGAEKIFGYTAAEVIGKSITILIPPHRINEEPVILERIGKGESVEHYETVRRRKDGTYINISLTVSPIRDKSGKIIGASKIARDITERKRAEEALNETQAILSLSMQSSRMGAWTRDLATETVWWSEELEEIFGLEKGAFGGTEADFFDFVHEDDRETAWNEVQQAIEEHREYIIEFRFYHADGSLRWMEGRGRAVYSDKGEPVRVYGIGIDITERKKAEEIARQNARQLALVTDIAPVYISQCDSQRRYKFVNKANAERFGLKPEDFVGKYIPEIIGEEAYEVICPFIDKALSGEPVEFETEVPYSSIGTYYLHCSYMPEFDENGKAIGWVGAITDISERRKMEQALLEAERKAKGEYQTLLARISPLAETLGTARDLITIYRSLLDFLRASMPLMGFFVSFCEEDSKLRRAAYVWGEGEELDAASLPPIPLADGSGPNSRAIRTGKTVVFDRYMERMKNNKHILVGEDNGLRPNSSLVSPMIVMNRIIGTLEVQAYEQSAYTAEHIVALEMAANLAAVAIENVRLLKTEADARLEAEAANLAKDEFLSVLSHELRTPLNSMLGWIRMLRAGMLDEEKSVKALEVIERNTFLQNNLIEDLLDVSRIISGKMRIEKEQIDLVKVFTETVEILRPAAAQKNISFEFAAKENSLIIDGDATRLQQIITNLVQNAIKFTPEGGNISVSLARRGNLARLIVKDNGIGINPEILPFIFERFQQADSSTKRNFSGLGLGLTIVRNLVELHGGTTKAESEGSGKGAMFIIEIPLSEEFLEKMSADKTAQLLSENNFALRGARILLVDDDVESLIPLQIFLEREKAETVLATSAKEALEKLSKQNFHVLITDIGMPLTDGYDLIAKVRQLQTEHNAFITAIALTAYASSDDRRRALAAGFQRHIAKPVDFEELLSVIKEIYENN